MLVSTLTLTACLDSTTLVKVKPDGSGTVEQTTLVNTAAMKGMMGAQGGAPSGPMMNKADLERTAERMGKGVRLIGTEQVKGQGGFEGVKATFAFDDINQIQISQDPNMSGSTSGRLSSEPNADDPVKFKFTRGASSSTLSINYVDKPSGTRPPNQAGGGDMPDLTNPMIMNMMKTMFQGFKINIGLEVIGQIVKTNAEYVAGPRITLLEMDVAELLANEAVLKQLQSKLGPDVSLSEVKPYLKNVKGIKIDGPSINVEFR
ncbi:MAG TPA: hypothetical protein VEA16_20460 [Vicinamibacterales bacterium]|nr:hypothetical protein [Vicinamibacterales bacterium]